MTAPFDINDPANASAARILQDQLNAWGIGELYQDAFNLMKAGYQSSAIILELQNTQAYKVRFAANEDRRARGLPALSPAEYVATEAQYKNVMRMYGMPAGFYDTNDDLRKYLAADVAPQELAERVDMAQKLWLSKNPAVRTIAKDFYGWTDGDGIAMMLDPARAMPDLQRKYQAVQLGSIARENQLTLDVQRAETLADLGVDTQAATRGFAEIGLRINTESASAQRFGETITQTEQEDATFRGLASAERKRRRVNASEQGLFTGAGGASEGALGRSATGQY